MKISSGARLDEFRTPSPGHLTSPLDTSPIAVTQIPRFPKHLTLYSGEQEASTHMEIGKPKLETKFTTVAERLTRELHIRSCAIRAI